MNFFAVLAEMYKLCHSKDALLGAAKFFLNNLHMGKIKKKKESQSQILCVCVTMHTEVIVSFILLVFLKFKFTFFGRVGI